MKESERDELIKVMETLLEDVKRNPKIGRELLIGAGILNEDGTFTEHYKTLEGYWK